MQRSGTRMPLPSTRPTLYLGDDHPIILEGLRRLLAPDCEVVGAATEGRALLEGALRFRPDLVMTEISMPGMDGIEVTHRLRAVLPEARVLIFSVHAEPTFVHAAFEAGVCGYLTKTSPPDEIERAVREVLADRFYVSPSVARAAVRPQREPAMRGAAPPAGVALTRRESDILQLVAQGLGNREIADRLGVEVTTVRTHLSSVYSKLQLESRVELALFAAQADGTMM